MGSLSENDSIYYIPDIQKTVFKFNKTYFGDEYSNINETINKFLLKVNETLLEKLRRSFDIKLVKFSSILSETTMKIVEEVVLFQYYQIETFVNNSSNIIRMKIDEFLEDINNTNIFLVNLNDYIYLKIIGNYKILHTSIQNKFTIIDSNSQIESNSLIDSAKINNMKNDFIQLLDELDNQIQGRDQSNTEQSLQQIFEKLNEKLQKASKIINKGIKYESKVSMPFPILPFFEIDIKFNVSTLLGLNASLDINNDNNFLPLLVFDSYIAAKVDLSVEGGFYIPSKTSPVRIDFIVGMGGTVGDGKAGIKIELSLMENEFDFEVYLILNEYIFQFYLKIEIFIDIPLVVYNDEFYIVNYELKGISTTINDLKKKDMVKFMLTN